MIDAAGRVLAPGFIDTHSRHDLELDKYRGRVSQGITTIIVGQDGSSQFPLQELFQRLDAAPVGVNVASFSRSRYLARAGARAGLQAARNRR